MFNLGIVAVDLIAALALSLGYFQRYRRRDVMVAIVGLNLAVLAVTTVLATSAVSMGLGLGLFGVLSIIRLRSTELTQAEVTYYFTALATGLLAGIEFSPLWLGPAMTIFLVTALLVIDSMRSDYREQSMTIEKAYTDERALAHDVGQILGAEVAYVRITKVDLVKCTTNCEVRYRLLSGQPLRTPIAPTPAPDATVISEADLRALTGQGA